MAQIDKPRVILLHCAEYDPVQVEARLRQMVSLAEVELCRPGQRVLLKPNMLSPESADSACNTHPAVVEGAIKLVKSAGGQPFLGDKPVLWNARRTAGKSGILEVCQRCHVPVVEFGRNRPTKYHNAYVAEQVTPYDVILNLAKLKAHGQMILTAGVKNMFGCVSLPRRVWRHFSSENDHMVFSRMLLQVYQALAPRFTIVDGILAMEGSGPRGGIPRRLGLLIGGSNAVAVDRVIAEILGLSYLKLPTLAAARELDMPGWDLEQIQVLGDSIESVKIADFKLPAMQDIRFEVGRSVKILLRGLIKGGLGQ